MRGAGSRVVDRRIGMCCGSTVDSGGGCKVVGPGEASMISLLCGSRKYAFYGDFDNPSHKTN